MKTSVEIILGAILGTILSILVTVWAEMVRKPKLNFRIPSPTDIDYDINHPAQTARFLGILVENKPLSRFTRWLSRSAALQCRAVISFYHLDGQDVFGRSMIGRWSGSPEPIPMMQIKGENIEIKEITLMSSNNEGITTRRDIYPGETEKLDIAARFDDDDECYGWNNDSYFSEPPWRNPKWKLKPKRYLVKVEVISAGEKELGYFRLCNDVAKSSFRLEEAQKDDITLISY